MGNGIFPFCVLSHKVSILPSQSSMSSDRCVSSFLFVKRKLLDRVLQRNRTYRIHVYLYITKEDLLAWLTWKGLCSLIMDIYTWRGRELSSYPIHKAAYFDNWSSVMIDWEFSGESQVLCSLWKAEEAVLCQQSTKATTVDSRYCFFLSPLFIWLPIKVWATLRTSIPPSLNILLEVYLLDGSKFCQVDNWSTPSQKFLVPEMCDILYRCI